jgi:crotonobetainyl-CoA:carnitine CoA-transferase CaiB-like acyl-CoA transferase|tara:strand:- start:6683 stop:7951 length:1269 start_codon:yes stop_codon:yes gene_type:complete
MPGPGGPAACSEFSGGIVSAPLADITVIEVDNYMAAPSAGAILADMGATVIKVEPLGGDPMRGIGRPAKVEGALEGYDFGFDVDNRGKRSVAVALDTEEGAAVVHRLVESAQVFLCNLLPRRQRRFGLDPETLMKRNPALVHATLTGYGTNGPEAERPGYDVTAFFGRSGLYDAMREGDDGEVPMARPAQGDHTAGLALVGAILAALRIAERSGEGQVVETSLFETAIWTQATDFGVTAVDRAPVRRRSRHNQLTPAANRYPCGDGKWIVLNTLGPNAFEKLVEALGREDWLEDPRFQDAKSRYRHMPDLVDAMDGILAAKSRDEWGEVFDRAGIIWGPVLTLDEVARDKQAEAIGMFPEIEHAERGRYRSVRAPMRFRDAEVRPRGPSPTVGQHTREVLAGAGFSSEEIDGLFAGGALGES